MATASAQQRVAREAMLVVALVGERGAGKTYAAQHLRDAHGAAVLNFADPLKAAVRELFRFDDDQVFGDARAKERKDDFWGFTPREAMLALGGYMRHGLQRDLPTSGSPFVRVMRRRLEEVLAGTAGGRGPSLVAIGDLRYPDEVRLVRETFGGVVWRVERMADGRGGGTEPQDRELERAFRDHESERLARDAALRVDAVLRNDGTPDAFRASVDAALTSLSNARRRQGNHEAVCSAGRAT